MSKKITKIKNKKEELKKLLENATNTFEDKLAILKYYTKKDSKGLSSALSNILKKKK